MKLAVVMLQAHVQQKTAAEQQEGLISASLTELQGLQATASGLREAGSITEAEVKLAPVSTIYVWLQGCLRGRYTKGNRQQAEEGRRGRQVET